MKLTALKALKETKKMWKWMALHPRQDKSDYFLENDIVSVRHYCYLCEYAYKDEACTSKCPLFLLWSKRKDPLYRCQNEDSPFYKWSRTGSNSVKAKTRYANEIVKLCDRKIKELQRKHGTSKTRGGELK